MNLTRGQLTELRRELESDFATVWDLPGVRAALLDMASRSVSEETVRKLAEFNRLAEQDDDEATKLAWVDFGIGTQRDLKEAAEARGRNG